MNKITYEEFQESMLQHRKQAIQQTKKAIARELRLELVAIREIADTSRDEQTKNQLYKRLNRLEKIYLNIKEN